jgi:purine-binding chemotaxis protein CheW
LTPPWRGPYLQTPGLVADSAAVRGSPHPAGMVSNNVAAEAGPYAHAAPHWVVFACDGRRFGIPLEHVKEILTPAPFTRLPGAGPAVCGLLASRGRIVTVLDVGVILGGRAAATVSDFRVLVMELGARRIGAVVDEVIMVTRALLDDVLPAGEQLRPDAVLGVAEVDGGSFVALDPAAMTVRLLQ